MTRARDLAAFVSNADGDIKFDTDTLFIDSSANNVGIGTDSPNHPLQINGGAADTALQITNSASGSAITDGFSITVENPTANVAVRNRENTNMSFLTNNTERMRIDNNGNVGIGTTSPNSYSNYTVLTLNGPSGGGAELDFERDGTLVADMFIDTSSNYSIRNVNSGNISIYTGGSERMRIGSTGRIDLGTTTNVFSNSSTSGINLFSTNGQMNLSQNGDTAMYINRNTNDGNVINFYRSAASKGSISVSSSAVSFNTSSDHRLKENVTNVTDGITRVKQLAPKRFNFIADADTTVDGFLAHEAQAVVPEAVTGTHNEVDEDGNAVMQGIDQSKLVPLLTAALQEAITKIETLETENTAIKARLDALEAE